MVRNILPRGEPMSLDDARACYELLEIAKTAQLEGEDIGIDVTRRGNDVLIAHEHVAIAFGFDDPRQIYGESARAEQARTALIHELPTWFM